MLFGELTESGFNLRFAGIALHAEDLVRVSHSSYNSSDV
jgi:hypothetical protein